MSSYNINLYKEKQVLQYAREIKFNNPHHEKRVKQFLVKKYGRMRERLNRHAWKACVPAMGTEGSNPSPSATPSLAYGELRHVNDDILI